WRTADEISGIIDAARALVFRDLRIRAQWPRAIHFAIGNVRSMQSLWGFALLHPLLERNHFVKHVRTFTAAAVAHPRCQEQPDILGRIRCAAHSFDDAVVVLNGIRRRNLGITPAVIHEEFPAM